MTDYSRAPWVDPKFNWKPHPVSELPERVLIDYATKCGGHDEPPSGLIEVADAAV